MAVIDRTTRQQLQEALDATDYCMEGHTTAGSFGARVIGCPGPDAPFVPMLTCRCCRSAQLLRRALKRLGIPPLPPVHERGNSSIKR